MATRRRNCYRTAALLAAFAALFSTSACAGLSDDAGGPSSASAAQPTESSSSPSALVANQLLVESASYGDGSAEFSPAALDAKPTVLADQLPELYAKDSPAPSELVDYDIALAQLAQVV